MNISYKSGLASLILTIALLHSCQNKEEIKLPDLVVIEENQKDIKARFDAVKGNTPFVLADGLDIQLFASDSLVFDPIAMSTADDGSIYISSTNRNSNSEFDIRGHQNWMTQSISFKSVEDRRTFLRDTFSRERSKSNEYLADLNEDGFHDWNDLAVEKEEIWKIEDTNKDGFADKSTKVFEGFNEEITDVAGALLIRKNDAFIGVGPDMWRLEYLSNGALTDPKSISHGYAVHIGFGGHGMSGLIEGPDGKIYWGIGDIGANLTDKEGNKHEYPNEGVIVRSNPDGTDFEIFASGLRNTHEFVFDQYGNLITSDNDGDHPGESERLVHLVQGSDSGWRSNWQYGKYTDPDNNNYKVWMDEKLFVPRWDNQAAYILPPIMNFHNGPTGMQFNPGTGLGKDWVNKFFLVEFVGNPIKSPIWAFDLQPKGASFELKSEQNILSGILPTGIKFGPDGALYIADWVNGWNAKNEGRIWKLDVTTEKNDLATQRAETNRLMQLDYDKEDVSKLSSLLAYEDMRIRQKAQFGLAKLGEAGLKEFIKVLNENDNQLAKIHAIWGIGQIAQSNKAAVLNLVGLLDDQDPEIIAQALKVIGDHRHKDANIKIMALLSHPNDRVKFYAAEALGRSKDSAAIGALIQFIKTNNDLDVYLRHAGVLALSRIGAAKEMALMVNDSSPAMRTAAVLVLRKLQDPKVAVFLNDASEYIATEAARAINDDLSIVEGLPSLAAMLNQSKFSSEPLMRRAINAALRIGDETSLNSLVNYAKRNDISDVLRTEALATLATWSQPSVLDRVDGRYRGKIQRDPAAINAIVKANASSFINSKNIQTSIAGIKLVSKLGLSDFNQTLTSLFNSSKSTEVKIALIQALAQLGAMDIPKIVEKGLADNQADVRSAAISILDKVEIPQANFFGIIKPIFDKGGIKEKQSLIKVLGKLPIEKTEKVLDAVVDLAIAKKLDNEVMLELSETVEGSNSEALKTKLKKVISGTDELDAYATALYGGNLDAGRGYFLYNSKGQCTRCHVIDEENKKSVGPALAGVGSRLDRKTLLASLVTPSARIAPGYGTVLLTLVDGQEVMGVLEKEDNKELRLITNNPEPMRIPVSRIKQRENMPSSMPAMSALMSKREIRDVVEFLSSLK